MREILIGLALWLVMAVNAAASSAFVCEKPGSPFYGIPIKKFFEGKLCEIGCPEILEIRDNCFLDKMKGRSKVEVSTVRRICSRIACNPTFFQKMKY